MKQLTVERDDALEVARKAEEHSRSLSTAARGGLLEAPSSGLRDSQQRAPLAPLGGQDVDGNRGALMTAPRSQERTYTSLMHELEVTKRKCREQAHELSQMVRIPTSTATAAPCTPSALHHPKGVCRLGLLCAVQGRR